MLSQTIGAMALTPAAIGRTTPGMPFVAADVGGTHARMALVQPDGTAVRIVEHRVYQCSDHPGLAEILADFLASLDSPRPREVAIACAGVLRDDAVISSNLPWVVSLAALRGVGVADVAVVNDFVAVAHAAQCMNPDEGCLLTPQARTAAPGNVLVVGPGTGLGAAIRVPLGDRVVVVPSEASHLAFAPGNAREIEVLAWLQRRTRHVANEQLVSGPGLLRLYRVLCALDGVAPRLEEPAAVPAAARRGDDPQACEAMRMFCGMFGGLIADLAMASGAGSVFVAGGIGPKVRDFLAGGEFNERFLDKGVMRPVLEQVPVHLIDNPHAGVIGAASWFLAERRERP